MGLNLYKRTDNLSESSPRMTSNADGTWQGLKGGQNFSVPLHDNNVQYDTVTTGLVMFEPDHLSPLFNDYMKANGEPIPSLPYTNAPLTSHSVNGCLLSQGANRTYQISEVGDYVLGTQLNAVLGLCKYFNVKMWCGGGAQTAAPAESDPLGFSVDAQTGAITGTPQNVRDGYKMRLRAVDAAEARTTVAEWAFDVKPSPEFSLKPSARWSAETNGSLDSKYHIDETHLLPKPPSNATGLLQYPAGGDFGKVVYLLSAKAAGDKHVLFVSE